MVTAAQKNRKHIDEDGELRAAFAEAVAAESYDPQFSDNDIYRLSHLVLKFCEKAAGFDLYYYEKEFALGVIFSILKEDAEEITALFSRQSGKTETISVVVVGLMILLPTFALNFKEEPRLQKFKDGFWVGIYGPNASTSGIMYSRMQSRLYSKSSKSILNDPELDLELPARGKRVALSNGSYVLCKTAAPGAKIEGWTYHLIILEEAQNIGENQIKKSIYPMAASTAATIVNVGTPSFQKSTFEGTCNRNRQKDLNRKLKYKEVRNHYEFDYTHGMKCNPRYKKFIEKEIERCGFDSDEFRVSFRLHWIGERGKFITATQLDECGIRDKSEATIRIKKDGKLTKFERPQGLVTFDQGNKNQVAAIDFGKAEASTIVTVAKVFWENPIPYGEWDDRYFAHVQNWLELQGDDYEAQIPSIIDFLKNYSLGILVCDATGPGDPLYSRFVNELDPYEVEVLAFVFSAQSKDAGYKILSQELRALRFTYPDGYKARKKRKHKKFKQQMQDLQKRFRGNIMVVEKPEERSARDDYCDSLMMTSWGIVKSGEILRDVEVEQSPFGMQGQRNRSMYGRRARAWGSRTRLARRRR